MEHASSQEHTHTWGRSCLNKYVYRNKNSPKPTLVILNQSSHQHQGESTEEWCTRGITRWLTHMQILYRNQNSHSTTNVSFGYWPYRAPLGPGVWAGASEFWKAPLCSEHRTLLSLKIRWLTFYYLEEEHSNLVRMTVILVSDDFFVLLFQEKKKKQKTKKRLPSFFPYCRSNNSRHLPSRLCFSYVFPPELRRSHLLLL